MGCKMPGRIFLSVMLMPVVLIAPPVGATNDECPELVPPHANVAGALRLCHGDDGAREDWFVCRTYRDAHRTYDVVFHGGTSPVAVYEQPGAAPRRRRDVRQRRCRLEPPPGVPAGAAYRGTGVCEDEQGRPLPCSLYEHAAARQPEAWRYFVYYAPDGSGVRHIDTLSAGHNKHALEAEFAFQIGQALHQAGCCRGEAQGYFRHAAALFPDDATYRAAVFGPDHPDPVVARNPRTAITGMQGFAP